MHRRLGDTYHRGPVILRGPMIPNDNTTANLLKPNQETDWLHMDPWRVLRIQSEFVDGFGALAELGPAVSVFGSARTPRTDPDYKAARRMGRGIAKHGVAVITGGGPGIMEAGEPVDCGRLPAGKLGAELGHANCRTSRARTNGGPGHGASAISSCARPCSSNTRPA